MNSLSAFAMAIVAVIVFIQLTRIGWPRFFRNLYTLALTTLWLGTVFFHATLTEMGEWSDGLGLYAVILFFICYLIGLCRQWSYSLFTIIYVITVFSAGAFAWNFMHWRLMLFGTLVVAAVLTVVHCARHLQYSWRDLLLALGAFVTGLIFQVLDNTLVLCSRFSLWQGHALWHILAAAATYWLALFMARARLRV